MTTADATAIAQQVNGLLAGLTNLIADTRGADVRSFGAAGQIFRIIEWELLEAHQGVLEDIRNYHPSIAEALDGAGR